MIFPSLKLTYISKKNSAYVKSIQKVYADMENEIKV